MEVTKEQLNKALDGPVDSLLWTFLDKYAFTVDRTPKQLASVVREMHQAVKGSNNREGNPLQEPQEPEYVANLELIEPASSRYHEVLSALIAREAANHRLVTDFRTKILTDEPSNLLKPDKVDEWIRGKVELNWPPEVRDSVEPDLTLEYTVPDDPYSHIAWVVDGGFLGGLCRISEQLAEEFRWHQAEATSFVLAGVPPVVRRISGGIAFNLPDALFRIHLSIDPALTPKEVAAEYARIRGGIIHDKRTRTLNDKNIELASFAATEGIELALVDKRQLGKFRFRLVPPKGKWWDKLIEDWNKACPEDWDKTNPDEKWRYASTDIRHFKRDCRRVLQHMLYPGYHFSR